MSRPLTFLDLESNQPSGKIISVGICIADLDKNIILEQLNIYVKLDEELNPYITELTGITPEILEREGISLSEAYYKIRELHKKHKCFINPVTWGGSDSHELRSQLMEQYAYNSGDWCFGHRWVDIKTLFQILCLRDGKRTKAGLATAMDRCGLKFEGTPHRADVDAYNTFLIFKHLYKFLPKDVING